MNSWLAIWGFRSMLLEGFLITVLLSVIAIIGGTILGMIVAVGYTGKNKILRAILTIYVEIFRGSPLLLQLFIGYFGMAYLGFELSIWEACIYIMILYTGAYVSEIIRSGIESIPKGQYEAAKCIGLSKIDTLRVIILPQTFKKVKFTLIGFFIGLTKDTTIASLVGFNELLKQSKLVINATGYPLQVYFVVGALFFIMCLPLSKFAEKNSVKGASRAA